MNHETLKYHVKTLGRDMSQSVTGYNALHQLASCLRGAGMDGIADKIQAAMSDLDPLIDDTTKFVREFVEEHRAELEEEAEG